MFPSVFFYFFSLLMLFYYFLFFLKRAVGSLISTELSSLRYLCLHVKLLPIFLLLKSFAFLTPFPPRYFEFAFALGLGSRIPPPHPPIRLHLTTFFAGKMQNTWKLAQMLSILCSFEKSNKNYIAFRIYAKVSIFDKNTVFFVFFILSPVTTNSDTLL